MKKFIIYQGIYSLIATIVFVAILFSLPVHYKSIAAATSSSILTSTIVFSVIFGKALIKPSNLNDSMIWINLAVYAATITAVISGGIGTTYFDTNNIVAFVGAGMFAIGGIITATTIISTILQIPKLHIVIAVFVQNFFISTSFYYIYLQRFN